MNIQLINGKKEDNAAEFRGWILYTMEDSIRNRHYIELYQKACKKYGMSIELGIYQPDMPDFGQSEGGAGGRIINPALLPGRERPVFAVNRTRDYRLAKALEELGVRVYNPSRLAELGNDKAKAYRYMEQRGIEIMPTAYETDSVPERFPVVVKACAGHGGTEVFLINCESEWEEWKQKKYRKTERYVVQQAASDLGRDVRVYIVGNQIVASVLRTSRQDFRSNFCLGGKAELFELNDAQRRLVETITAGLTIGMAGIDFVFHQNRMIFNEIEDMAGARMLYSLTEYDIVDEYVGYIWKELRTAVP